MTGPVGSASESTNNSSSDGDVADNKPTDETNPSLPFDPSQNESAAEPASDQTVHPHPPRTIAMVGNPNVGKTSIFNRLTSLLAKTSNFPGTTVDKRSGTADLGEGQVCTIVDLPGLYSLDASSPEEKVAEAFLSGAEGTAPDLVIIVVDALNLQRSLFIARQAMQCGRPTVVAVNMIELARKRGMEVDLRKLHESLECPVVGVSARTGEGFEQLRSEIRSQLSNRSLNVLGTKQCTTAEDAAECGACGSCPYAEGHRWAATLARDSTATGYVVSDEVADRFDGILTHPIVGPAFFATVMLVAFALVFGVAQYPMEILDGWVGSLATLVGSWLPNGDFSSLITDGIIGGVGSVLIFLPQICILFFALAVLEDSGYLARAVVVIDRWMRRVGLPGQAFVPLLAAHACAIPAIMSTKVIENPRDRLAAILVIPLMTCSARLPVYAMVAALLFPDNAWYAASLFAAAYGLGMVAAFTMSWLLKVTILPGKPSPLILDLPPYRMPSFLNAARHAYERGWVFLRDAGTIILVISIVIWLLSTYPKLSDDRFEANLATVGVNVSQVADTELENIRAAADQEHAIIGRMGKFVAPVFAPLGFDWKTSVGVMTSFAAREVVVSTLSILYGLGPEPEDDASLRSRLKSATHEDGSPVFTMATSISLLVFFVLAMQCLPTQAVTKKETGSWRWAAFQFTYMTLLAYGAAMVAYQTLSRV